ncbi:hypothetical protein AB0K43_30460 [Kitasatospora sp. NPDC049258]|uniref:Rv1733c family protein n=1 Tax=Kitasatospora sp. NPDC049258 TaxID=3155394 RepID=UPI00343132BC
MARRAPKSGPPTAHTTLREHLRRAVGRDGNPLCRCADRARSRLVAGLVLALAAALAAGALLAVLTWDSGRHEAAAEALHRHRTTATTLATAVPDGTAGSPVDGTESVLVEASWSYPQAGQVSGWVSVPSGTAAGSQVPVWVDDGGQAAPAPRSGTDIVLSAVVTGLLSSSGLAVAAGVACALRYRMVDRRARAAWEPAWERVEPLWSGRTPGRPGGTDA